MVLWKSNNNEQKWPAPEGALAGNVTIFWDMDNVPLYAPYDRSGLFPHDQFDVLLRVFGKDLGHKVHIRMNVVIAEDKFNWYPADIRRRIKSVHSQVTFQCVAGRFNGGKRDISDNVIKPLIADAVHKGHRGDAIVLISGDGDFVPEVRAAKNAGINVYLLTPEVVSTSTELSHLAHWQQYFNRFMELHRLDYFPHLKQKYDALKQQPKPPMRPKPGKMTPEQIEQAKPMGEILEKGELEAHLKEEQEQTQLDILIMIDGTNSMQPYIDSIKDAISSELIKEIQRRYSKAAGNVRYGVLVYRDIVRGPGDPQQFERLDFTTDPEKVVEFLSNVKAMGGRDYTEDVTGAMLEAVNMGWQRKNKAIFHVLDAPSHGQEMHDLGERNDDYLRSPPEGRDRPEVEARRAMQKLHSLGLQRYMLCHLEKGHCAKMAAKFQEILREDGIDKTEEESNWLAETEVKYEAGAPSKLRLADLVGKLIGETVGTISASLSRASLARKLPHTRVRAKVHEPDVEMAPVAEGEEGDGSTSDTASVEEVQKMLEEWSLEGKTEKAWEATLAKYKKAFKVMRKNQAATQVEITMPPDYQGDLKRLLEDVDDHFVAHGTKPTDPYRNYLIRHAPPPGFEGTHKVAFLAQEQIKNNNRRVERKAADGTMVVYTNSVDYPIVVLKEYNTAGKGQNTAQRYKKEVQANGVAALLASLFNERVKEVESKLSAPPKTLSYLETCLVSYQGIPSGTVSGTAQREPSTMFRLQEPLVMGNFVKWSSNAGYVNMEVWDEVAHAFTHWTYHATEGRLMVADIQGVRVGKTAIKLTDPQIHCVHPTLLTDDASSFGRVGMLRFFQSHRCGETCKALGLNDSLDELDKLRAELGSLGEEAAVIGDAQA